MRIAVCVVAEADAENGAEWEVFGMMMTLMTMMMNGMAEGVVAADVGEKDDAEVSAEVDVGEVTASTKATTDY